MTDFLVMANKNKDELIANRRYLHANAEVADILPKTSSFIKSKLVEYGCEYEELVPHGIVVNIGNREGKTILIRADIDALPQREASGEVFACTTGAAHSCGHDIHTAALLGCAKMLKLVENELCGNVKLVFQPDEERVLGAVNMINAGVMENPHVDSAIAMHTNLPLKAGTFNVLGGTYLSSSDLFKVTIEGIGSHSSSPDKGVDPILVAAKIIESAQTITSREIDALTPVILTFGSIHAGAAANIIPQELELVGTIRAFDKEVRGFAKERFEQIVNGISATFRAKATLEFTSSTPTTYNDPQMTEQIVGFLRELISTDDVLCKNLKVKGSDDFAYFSDIVPGVMYHVGMGSVEEGYTFGLHNPAVRFDESSLPNSAAAFAHIAKRWLEQNK